jgi:hypothetical protein
MAKVNLNTRVKGLAYENVAKQSNDDVMYINDDRFDFVGQLHVTYFWSLSEVSGLTQHVSQNCSSLNMCITDTVKRKSSSTSGKVVGRSEVPKGVKNNAKRPKLEDQTEALFAMVNDIKNGLLTSTNDFKKSSLNSQLLEAEEAVIKL